MNTKISPYLREEPISATMSGMSDSQGRTVSQQGMSVLAVPFALSVIFLVGAIVFGAWAFMQMQDYKNNVAAKVNVAVNQAKQQEDQAQQAIYSQKEKSPYRTYKGPGAYGSIVVTYPKTWSAYVIDDQNGSPYVNGYFYPGTVPNAQGQNAVFALRVQVVQDTYSSVLGQAQNSVQNKQATVAPYSLPRVSSVVGAMVSGTLPNQRTGTMVILPLRNMTLEIWTESTDFQDDFQNIILPNFTFAP